MTKIVTKKDLLAMPASDYMNKVQLAFFKNMLEDQKNQILLGIESVKGDLINSQVNADVTDEATTIELQHLELKRIDRERKLLNKISYSLDLINQKEYGYCQQTGDEIGLGRLIARPTATLSITAKETQEFKERTVGTE